MWCATQRGCYIITTNKALLHPRWWKVISLLCLWEENWEIWLCLRSHTGEKPYKCNVLQQKILWLLIPVKTSPHPRWWKNCSSVMCVRRVIVILETLMHIMRTHTGEQPYNIICLQCVLTKDSHSPRTCQDITSLVAKSHMSSQCARRALLNLESWWYIWEPTLVKSHMSVMFVTTSLAPSPGLPVRCERIIYKII